jgi:tetratricopeptide (TPR) repeat protein
MAAGQAARALLASADYLMVVFHNQKRESVQQSIDKKSLRVSSSRLVFYGADADRYNGGKHRYVIDFATLPKLSYKCSRMQCVLRSEGAAPLGHNELGEPLSAVAFEDPAPAGIPEGTPYKATCAAACRKAAQDFDGTLSHLQSGAISQPVDTVDFHQQAAAWRALAAKPPLSDAVRIRRIAAEDAIKNRDPNAALEYYEEGLDLYPTWPEGWFNAALIEGQLGAYDEAVYHMQNYLELLPNAADAQSARDQIDLWQLKAKEHKPAQPQ